VRRFDEMIRRTGAPRDTLAARLKTLVVAGVLERSPVSEHPPRFEYRLTQAGLDLYPVIVALLQWGDQHARGADGPPLVLEHHCGKNLGAISICAHCGEKIEPSDVKARMRASFMSEPSTT
jgi:hypothetical protein